MKISSELIQQSNQFINPINERQLDLKGYKIAMIENLGATLDFFECIDLSDNEISKLGNFTILKRLKSLIVCNNHISRILNIGDSLINLENLSLMNNKLVSLQDIDNLASCKKLQRLYLNNNQVTQKVRQKEREEAIAFLQNLEKSEGTRKSEMEKQDKKKIVKSLIEKALTVEEVNRLELLLKTEEINEALFDQKLKELKK